MIKELENLSLWQKLNSFTNLYLISLETQCCTGYSLLFPPFTRTETNFTGKITFRFKSQPTQLRISKPN